MEKHAPELSDSDRDAFFKAWSSTGSKSSDDDRILAVYAMVEQRIRTRISEEIRNEFVCGCNTYDKVQEIAKSLEGTGAQLWNPGSAVLGYHGICHWGEASARIAEGRSE